LNRDKPLPLLVAMVWAVLTGFIAAFIGPAIAVGKAAKLHGIEPSLIFGLLAAVGFALSLLKVGSGLPRWAGLTLFISVAVVGWAVCLYTGWLNPWIAARILAWIALSNGLLSVVLVPIILYLHRRRTRGVED